MRYVGSQYVRLDDGSLIYNRNFLISPYYNSGKSYLSSSATGMVAGSSNESGYVIARSETYNSYEYICIVLGAERDEHFIYSYDVSSELIKWGSKNYSFLTILDKNRPVTAVSVKNARENDTVPIIPSDTLTRYMLSDSFTSGKLRTEIVIDRTELSAPVSMGTAVGRINVYYEDELLITSDLVTACEISENTTSSMIHRVWNNISSKKAIRVYTVVIACVLAYILINSIIRYQRKIRRDSDA
jgi:D-alanyl-D-alanine carboxypeptidase